MTKKYYPTKTSHRNYPIQRNTLPSPPLTVGVPNIFANNHTLRHEVANGRVHCVAVQRTAIYKDAHGNKIVLKENQTNMNVPETLRGSVRFADSNHGNWRKK